MVKILHTADIHLGAQFAILGERADEYRQQLKKTFVKVVDLALSEKVNLVLVAGDLFDSNFSAASTLSLVKDQFKRLKEKNIQVAILPGTHDCLDDNSIYWREVFGSNVYVFKKSGARVYGDLDLMLWAKPNTAHQSSESPLNFGRILDPRIKSEDDERGMIKQTKYSIALAHGSVIELAVKVDDQQYPLHLSEITNSQFDYVALGHWHSLRKPEEFNNKACYPGSPEPLSLTQSGAGYVALINLDNGLEIKLVKVGSKEFDKIVIDLSLLESEEQIKKAILKGAMDNLIRQVEFRGLRPANLNIDLEILVKELADNFFRLVMRDDSQFMADQFDPSQFPQELVIGQFARLMQEHLRKAKDEREKNIIQQAIQMGIMALQKGEFNF
ncbi:MAG: hypothetical protein COS76_01885 [Candidatus Portnoybacteria bacterium CG06_land_8_20_14_3_00_39_12]|uniref:Calcineurin-like phosphoesterase domain-containing protein n=2 Tax=Candidatus Portnoyibacteriota TaxID=1817913 RepID=A0A2M8KG60_9BACT|nr:MAG: hypothetical protein AUJ33_00635 [Parcubacteria group bacterium CG1_02_40_25]PIU75234.1 MAG: hypothetical protein COS76_01885 [Candidatus Portnoybacteria bacterium CG06_land_8_20_14_3_00_39_12]PJE58915.1 MAG: hypothetical protein COU83_01285 [Candidatus Portnoybacteria bacterium CG10_big_fil_rev_8_21_14_0_10_40_22]